MATNPSPQRLGSVTRVNPAIVTVELTPEFAQQVGTVLVRAFDRDFICSSPPIYRLGVKLARGLSGDVFE